MPITSLLFAGRTESKSYGRVAQQGSFDELMPESGTFTDVALRQNGLITIRSVQLITSIVLLAGKETASTGQILLYLTNRDK